MAPKSSIKVLIITLTLIGLAIFLSLQPFAAPKWPIPDGVNTIEVNSYDMAYQETASGIPLQHASDVGALIKELNLGKVHLLGHSRGGQIVLTVANQYPEVIRTVILEDGNIDSMMPETPEK